VWALILRPTIEFDFLYNIRMDEDTKKILASRYQKYAAEKAEAERITAEKAEAERITAEKAEAERITAEKAEAERITAEKAEAERITAEVEYVRSPLLPITEQIYGEDEDLQQIRNIAADDDDDEILKMVLERSINDK